MERRDVARSLALILASLLAFPASVAGKPKRNKDSTDVKAPVITHVRVASSERGKPIVVRARIEDESEVFAPAVYVRVQGDTEFETFGMKRVENGFEATIPAEKTTRGNVEYFVEAFDQDGNGPSRDGSPEQPIRIQILPPGAVITPPAPQVEPSDEDSPVTSTWWFWTAIGVAVVGVGAAIVLAASAGGNPATVDVDIVGPDPAEGL